MCVSGTRDAVRSRDHHHPLPSEPPGEQAHRDDVTEHARPRPTMSRRRVLGVGLGATLAAVVPASPALARRIPTRQVLDLSQVFSTDMPTYGPEKPSREVFQPMPPPGEFGFYNQRWVFTEHVGTHIDAPGHVIGGGRLTTDLDPDELLAPAVVIDITSKAAQDPNAVVTVDDVIAFERRHGRIPRGAAVLMNSGWARFWDQGDLAYRGTQSLDEFPFNFPGFSAEACDFLIRNRDIAGVGVDTSSTDPGESTDFPAHEVLGRADRWGLENLTNLDRMPPRGATIVVGLVPWEESSGGPCRLLAMW
jgi:kynurenine formamidase